MLLAGADGRITRVNARIEQLFGYRRSELIGQAVEMLVPERFRPQHATDRAGFFTSPHSRAMGAGRDLYGLRKDGSEVPIEIGLSPITWPEDVQVMASIIDITERKRTENALRHAKDQLTEVNEQLEVRVRTRTEELELANRELVHDIETRKRLENQLRQSQKLESIGTLAAGIAHDFNNILNIINAFASVLRPHGSKISDIGESLDVIDAQVKRGAALAQQLLTIGRKAEGQITATDINALLRQLARVLQETFPKTVETKLDLRPEIPTVLVDPNQINQAVLNLCVNARDAMPEGGRLTIKSDLVDAQSLPDAFQTVAQRYRSIEIIDTGSGIGEHVRGHLFEPFMTTKELGHGSGLGLAVAYGIIQSHNGFIHVESKPKEGSKFQIFLPVTS
jgi:PAS domain S-box-containing protein